MIELLITLVFLVCLIWLAKLTFNKIFSRANSAQAEHPVDSLKASNQAFKYTSLPAPELLKEMYRLEPGVYVFSDLETTGLYPEQDDITEIAAIKYSGGDNLESFSTFVKPSVSIPAKVTKITGITNKMVANAPSIKTVMPVFKDFISDAELIFYNASFDEGFLKKAAGEASIPFHNKFIDALPIAREALPSLRSHKLTTVAEHLDITISNAHRALGDTTTLMFVYLGCTAILLERNKLMNVTTLGERAGGYSAITVNKALIEQGFQTKARNDDGQWVYTPTDKGKPFIQFNEDGLYFLWEESVIEELDMQSYKPMKKKPHPSI